jgi:hypothetical protein
VRVVERKSGTIEHLVMKKEAPTNFGDIFFAQARACATGLEVTGKMCPGIYFLGSDKLQGLIWT